MVTISRGAQHTKPGSDGQDHRTHFPAFQNARRIRSRNGTHISVCIDAIGFCQDASSYDDERLLGESSRVTSGVCISDWTDLGRVYVAPAIITLRSCLPSEWGERTFQKSHQSFPNPVRCRQSTEKVAILKLPSGNSTHENGSEEEGWIVKMIMLSGNSVDGAC